MLGQGLVKDGLKLRSDLPAIVDEFARRLFEEVPRPHAIVWPG